MEKLKEERIINTQIGKLYKLYFIYFGSMIQLNLLARTTTNPLLKSRHNNKSPS